MVHFFRNKFPENQQILPFFGLIIFIVFSWSIFSFFHKLPSWVDLLPTTDIFFVLCYTLAFDLIESFGVLCANLLIGFLLPVSWFVEKFKAQASATLLLVTFARFYVLLNIQLDFIYMLIFIAILLANILIIRLDRFERVLDSFIDRFILFFYVYVPLGLIGLVIVAIRNFR